MSSEGCGTKTAVIFNGADHSAQGIHMGCQHQWRTGTTQGDKYISLIGAFRGITQGR